MPSQKYYCDYCDKQFLDTPSARKRHLQGVHHIRARAQWFDSLRLPEPNQASADGFGKGVCNRFVKTGFCQYGDSCKYVHPKNVAIPGTGNVVSGSMGMAWENLPPSLRPQPDGVYMTQPFVDWG